MLNINQYEITRKILTTAIEEYKVIIIPSPMLL